MKLSQEERRSIILNGNVLKTLMILSIPTLMMALVQAMIPFTDGLYLNNIVGAERAGAITYSQPAINMIIGISQGLGVAAIAMIGQMAGKGDARKVRSLSLQILIFGIFCGIFMIPINFFIALYMTTTVEMSMKRDIFLYISMYSVVIPFQFMASIFNSIKNATGNPEAPFYRIVVLLLLKLVFNFIFLYLFRLDLVGAILASFSAYLLTAIWMYYDLFIVRNIYRLKLRKYKFEKNVIKVLLRLSLPSMISFMMINLGFLLINLEIAKYGRIVISGIGIAGTINSLCFQLPSCIGTSVSTMVSINIGVNNAEKCKKIFKTACIFSFVISIITLVIIIPNVDRITLLFTHKENILNVANSSLKIYTYSIIPYGIFMVCQSVYQALGKNIVPLIMGFMRIWLFRYLFIIFTQSFLSYYSVFYGNLFSNILSMLIFLIILSKLKWSTGIKYE